MIEPLVRAGMDDTRLASFYIHSDGVLSVGPASTIKVNKMTSEPEEHSTVLHAIGPPSVASIPGSRALQLNFISGRELSRHRERRPWRRTESQPRVFQGKGGHAVAARRASDMSGQGRAGSQ